MAPDDLDATLAGWRAIEQAATPGEWTTQKAVIAGIGGAYVIEHGELEIALVDCAGDLRLEQEQADAAFIVTARTAMPLLIGAVEAVLKLAGKAGVRLSACGVTGRCSCGEHPVAWNLDPAKVREAITAALREGGGDELAEPAS